MKTAATPGASQLVRNAGRNAPARIRQLMQSALSPNRNVAQMRANMDRLSTAVESTLEATKAAMSSGVGRKMDKKA